MTLTSLDGIPFDSRIFRIRKPSLGIKLHRWDRRRMWYVRRLVVTTSDVSSPTSSGFTIRCCTSADPWPVTVSTTLKNWVSGSAHTHYVQQLLPMPWIIKQILPKFKNGWVMPILLPQGFMIITKTGQKIVRRLRLHIKFLEFSQDFFAIIISWRTLFRNLKSTTS